jgi:hypothetical protein
MKARSRAESLINISVAVQYPILASSSSSSSLISMFVSTFAIIIKKGSNFIEALNAFGDVGCEEMTRFFADPFLTFQFIDVYFFKSALSVRSFVCLLIESKKREKESKSPTKNAQKARTGVRYHQHDNSKAGTMMCCLASN